MKRQIWACHIWLAAVMLSVAGVFSANWGWAAAGAVLAVSSWLAGRAWNRQDPIPMPYFMRWILFLPRGLHSPRRFTVILGRRSGQRILDVGPGVGIHAVTVATALLPRGVLDALDIQHDMLDDVKRRAARAGLTNVAATQGDAQALPYASHTFDAAYMIGTLGEMPNEAAALGELRRVLKPGARLVIGEVLIDPDFVSLGALQGKARNAGFAFERSVGPGFAYSAVFRS